MSMEAWKSLLAPVDRELLDSLRREWDWLLPRATKVLGLTMMGDWLIEENDGAILVLDTLEGVVIKVAGSVADLSRLLRSASFRDEKFLEGLALGVLRGQRLPRNHCVGYVTPPALGGAVDTSNLEVVSVERYQTWMGRLHKALASVPEGCEVSGVKVNEDGSVGVSWR